MVVLRQIEEEQIQLISRRAIAGLNQEALAEVVRHGLHHGLVGQHGFPRQNLGVQQDRLAFLEVFLGTHRHHVGRFAQLPEIVGGCAEIGSAQGADGIEERALLLGEGLVQLLPGEQVGRAGLLVGTDERIEAFKDRLELRGLFRIQTIDVEGESRRGNTQQPDRCQNAGEERSGCARVHGENYRLFDDNSSTTPLNQRPA